MKERLREDLEIKQISFWIRHRLKEWDGDVSRMDDWRRMKIIGVKFPVVREAQAVLGIEAACLQPNFTHSKKKYFEFVIFKLYCQDNLFIQTGFCA